MVFVDDGSTDGSMAVLIATPRRDDERRRRPPPPELRQGGRAAGRIPRGSRRRRRDDRRRPPGRPGRDPEAARQARRGLRPRVGLEDAAERPVPPTALLALVQLGDRRRLRRPAARRQLRPEGVPRGGARGDAPVRRAPSLHPGARRLSRLPGRRDPGESPCASARTLALRARSGTCAASSTS